MITGVHHIAVIASSEASIAFYARLGFRETCRIRRSSDTVVLLEHCGTELEVFIDPRHPPRAVEPENTGLRYLAFRVDDVRKAAEEYGGGSVQEDWHGKKYVFIHDPDGLPIQLHE